MLRIITQIFVSIGTTLLSPFGIAWMMLMKEQYALAKMPDSDGGVEITWWEIRKLFLDAWRTMPVALKEVLKKFLKIK